MRWMLLLLTLLLPVAGCQSDYGQASNPYPVAAAEYDRLFESAQHVLRKRGFTIDRASHRFGLIQTEPRSAPTAFEPIRNNNVGLKRQAQATARHVRRIVTVRLEPAGDNPATQPATTPADRSQRKASADRDTDIAGGFEPPEVATTQPADGNYQLRVHVRLQAKQQPTRRLISGTGDRVFSDLDQVPKRWQQRGIEKNYWQTVGRDPKLETRLIHDIVRDSFNPTNNTAESP